MNPQQPPYSPNVVNQTVDYGGVTWKGNPGSGWTAQSMTGGAPVNNGGAGNTDPMALVRQAQQFQVEQNQPAIQTLQGQQGNLKDQYSKLLESVIGQGSVAMNTATSGENAFLASRGLLSNAGIGNNQLSQAQQGVMAQNQSAAANVGMGSAQDINQLAGQIAGLQAGNVPNALNFGGGVYGAGLQIPLIQAQAQQVAGQNPTAIAIQRLINQFQNVPAGNSLVNTLSNFAINPSMLTQQGGGRTFLQ